MVGPADTGNDLNSPAPHIGVKDEDVKSKARSGPAPDLVNAPAPNVEHENVDRDNNPAPVAHPVCCCFFRVVEVEVS